MSVEMSGEMSGQTLYVNDFNDLISCHLCRGYLIDATTLIECLHSFCKTCLLDHLDSSGPKSRYCPRCDLQIHKTRPKTNIRSDPTLQDMVYKLVPGLYKNEMNRRKEFYSKEGKNESIGLSNEERGEISGERLIFTPEDSICLSIEYFPQYVSHSLIPFSKILANGALNSQPPPEALNGKQVSDDSQRRYLKCEGGMRVIHLKKWIKLKYDIRDDKDIEILYKHDILFDDYTIIDLAYIYSWRRNGPLCLYYKIIETKKLSKMAANDPIQFVAPGCVGPKRRHKHILNYKKRKLIDETNMITTNPANEPLPQGDSSIINNVIPNETNHELMASAVIGDTFGSKRVKKLKPKTMNKKTKNSYLCKTSSKTSDLTVGSTDRSTHITNNTKTIDNSIIDEINGLNNKSLTDISITNSIDNHLKTIDSVVFGAVSAGTSTHIMNKMVIEATNREMDNNLSQTNSNHKRDNCLNEMTKKSSLVPQMDSNSDQNLIKTDDSIKCDQTISDNHIKTLSKDNPLTVQPLNYTQNIVVNAIPTDISSQTNRKNNCPNMKKVFKPKPIVKSNKTMNYITNDKISITAVPMPRPSVSNKSQSTIKSIIDQKRTQLSNNSLKNMEKIMNATKTLSQSPLPSPVDPISAFMASLMAPDFFLFPNGAINSPKCPPKPL